VLKAIIRKKILKNRKKKNNQNIKFSSLKIFNEIKKNNLKKITIGAYYPVNFEIDLLGFFKELENNGSQISLPVVKKNNQMDFYLWSHKDLLKLNKFGIPEPEKKKKVIPDIMFVPLVAFDSRLYRIGYGGGYYDRYFEKLSYRKNNLKIGIAYSFQKINKVDINKFDKKLDIIITEKYILK
jgi:5-formyltetrahydrofolate cyclo-ligase